jgi:hypothetical protein
MQKKSVSSTEEFQFLDVSTQMLQEEKNLLLRKRNLKGILGTSVDSNFLNIYTTLV